MYQHVDDHHNCRTKGAIAQRVFRKTVEATFPQSKIEKSVKDDDIHGIDYRITFENGKTKTYEVTGHFDPELADKYLRVTIGADGSDRVKHLFNARASYWAFYNPLYDERKLLVYSVAKCREYIQFHYGEKIKDKKYITSKLRAAEEGGIYKRKRTSYEWSDLIVYIPIAMVEKYAHVLKVPDVALLTIEE